MPWLLSMKTPLWFPQSFFARTLWLVLMVVLVPYLLLAAKARGLLKSPRGLKYLSRGAATFMAGAAAAIATRS